MNTQDNLTCRLAFLGESIDELKDLRSISNQLSAEESEIYSTKQVREYRKFAPEYCVLYPAAASDEVVKSLVSEAAACPRAPKIILLLAQLNTARLEKELKAMGAQPQIIHLERPDASRAAALIKSFLIKEQRIAPPLAGWEFVGATAPVHKLYDSIRSFARWDKDPVLIVGETGTGKELIARQLHAIRQKGDFRPYNAAAIPLNLAESLLFGHVKGAFTDAVSEREGYILKADNGTLFIDEIGDVDPAIQVKLLRTIQERKVFKLGEDESKGKFTNARFVFATNRNLKEAYRSGNFREDLFHRISALQIDVPPLRKRKADIPLLIEHFVKEFVNDYTEDTTDAGAGDAREPAVDIYTDNLFKLGVLFDYDWTGNVRELRNVVRQAAAMTGAGAIDGWLAELVGKKLDEQKERKSQTSAPQTSQSLNELGSFMNSLLDSPWVKARYRFERAYWQAAFLKTEGHYKEERDGTDTKRTTFYKYIAEPPEFTAEDLTGVARLLTKLKEQADPVSTYVRGHLTSRTKQMLKEHVGGEPSEVLKAALANELSQLIKDQNLYQAERFRDVQLTDETRDLIEHHGLHRDLFRLNRMLLEDAYPGEILKKRPSPEDDKKEQPDDSGSESGPESASQL
jgi:DNA-binding NtrC family response regulator